MSSDFLEITDAMDEKYRVRALTAEQWATYEQWAQRLPFERLKFSAVEGLSEAQQVALARAAGEESSSYWFASPAFNDLLRSMTGLAMAWAMMRRRCDPQVTLAQAQAEVSAKNFLEILERVLVMNGFTREPGGNRVAPAQ